MESKNWKIVLGISTIVSGVGNATKILEFFGGIKMDFDIAWLLLAIIFVVSITLLLMPKVLKIFRKPSESKSSLPDNSLNKIKETQRSRFKISCNSTIKGCFVGSPDGIRPSWKCLRVRVEFDGDRAKPITNCQGVLQQVTKDAKEKIDENVPLTFAPGLMAITLHDEEYLNIIIVTEINNKAQLYLQPGQTYPSSIDYGNLFSERGNYILKVKITGDDTIPIYFSLKFNWTGDWQTADLNKE